jgi:hypothetical protein
LKNKRIIHLIASLVLLIAENVSAAGYTGQKLFNTGIKSYDLCGYYSVGVLHGLELPGEPLRVCLPPEVDDRQIALVVIKYLNDHPGLLHLSASYLVFAANVDAFPCPVDQ